VEPYYTPRYSIDDYEVQSDIKGYYKRIKLHIHQIFGRFLLQEPLYFVYLLREDKP
jgi:hypothetical protein